MPRGNDRVKFKNEDLMLKVSPAVDRSIWDDNRYEAFIDELCGAREYQKEAIRTTLRYLLGCEYSSLRELARSNFEKNPLLEERYGSWKGMEAHLQLPNKLSATIDLATATGKSFVIYGLAVILLAEGVIDRALVLCPSTTIEDGLIEKFRDLASNTDLSDLLPEEAKISIPKIVNASESITEGSICVENYHAILEHVKSSIADSLKGRGAKAAVFNDEAHHVANESASKVKKWKEFLLNEEYGFKHIIGLSGTCYVESDYFADVIYRYSLRQAMEEKYAKLVNYIAEMPQTGDPDEKRQLICNHHEETKRRLKKHKITPLTIIVTQRIIGCKDVAEELKAFLVENKYIKSEEVNEKVLVVHSGAPDVAKLPYVDNPKSKVEWIVSVSMLNEGWDVKRVFLIVPHEERAFNSKLLIAQTLGRGLRIPEGWTGLQPEVFVFNHDAWASRIKDIVNEVLDMEKRLSSQIFEGSAYHFTLHNIDYALKTISIKKPMEKEYKLFAKGYIDIPTDVEKEDVSVEFEKATSGERFKWNSQIKHEVYTPREIAVEMRKRLEEAQDPEDPNPKMRTIYTDKYPIDALEKVVIESLKRRKLKKATEKIKQRFLQSLGTLRRKTSENVRYIQSPERFYELSTEQRQISSVSAGELRRDKTIFCTDQTQNSLKEEQVEFFDEATEPGAGYKCVLMANRHDFKTPLNLAIADSENERRFMMALLEPHNIKCYDAWIKSTSTRFYEIDYAWKKGDHPKRGKFSPDFFIKQNSLILVVEIKGDEEINEPSEENKKKNEYAVLHFKEVNKCLKNKQKNLRYKLNFLAPKDFNKYFQCLREKKIEDYRSELDVLLSE